MGHKHYIPFQGSFYYRCDSTNNHVIGAKFNEMKVMTMHSMIMGCFFVYVNKDIGIYPCCFAPTSVVILKGRQYC